MANHPNQPHILACGDLNGLIFIYDVRSNMKNKPFIMSQNNSEPGEKINNFLALLSNILSLFFLFWFLILVTEICFHPFSADSIFTSSFDGSLWLWNSSNKTGSIAKWDADHNLELKNLLPNNNYTLNSFDINNESILAVNNNMSLFKVKLQHFI